MVSKTFAIKYTHSSPSDADFPAMNDISKLLAAARGDVPSDVLITGGRVINVFSGEIESVDIAISGGCIGRASAETIRRSIRSM